MRRSPHRLSFRLSAFTSLALLFFLLSACKAEETTRRAMETDASSNARQTIKVVLKKDGRGVWQCAYKVVGSSADGFDIKEKEAFRVYPVGEDWKLDVKVATAPNRAEPIDGARERDRLPAGTPERFGIRAIDGAQNITRHKIDMLCRPPSGRPIVPDHDPNLTDSFKIMNEEEEEPTEVPPTETGGPVMEIDD